MYILAAAFILTAVCHIATCRAAIFRHDLRIELHLKANKLQGSDVIKVDSPAAGGITFLLSENSRISSISIDDTKARYSFRFGRLTLPPGSFTPGKPVVIRIAYEAEFKDPLPVDPVGFDNPGFGVEGTISETGVFLLPGSGWYPLTEGDNTFDVNIVVPRGVYAVTAGEPVGHRDEGDKSISTWKVGHLAQGLALSASRYTIRSEKRSGVPVYTYFFPEAESAEGEAKSLSDIYLEAASSHIKFYDDLHGPYAFPKFAVVENFFPTGYGFPSYTLLGSQVLRLPFIPQTSLRHEIAHCWWGNGVLVDYDSGNWSEGLTTYVADYLSREISSAKEAETYRRQVLRDYATLAASHGDFPLVRFSGRTDPATKAVGYGKAAFFFHMIRQKIGDEPFWRTLRRVYEQRFQVRTSWEDFRKAFVADGKWDESESKRFFDQWLTRKGAPELKLQNVTAKKIGDGWDVTGTVQQNPPYYDLDAVLSLRTSAEGGTDSKIKIMGESSPFVIRSMPKPDKLVLDPQANLFRLLYPEEIPATVNSLKGSRELVAVLGGGVSPHAAGVLKSLLSGLNHANTPIAREHALDPKEIRDKNVLFFGFPQSGKLKELLNSAPSELKISAEKFSMDGSFSSDTSDCLFIVFSDPRRGGRLTALFLPVTGKGTDFISLAARKITHYGQYSYLAFSNGTNQVKGTWQISNSPLIYEFAKKPGQSIPAHGPPP